MDAEAKSLVPEITTSEMTKNPDESPIRKIIHNKLILGLLVGLALGLIVLIFFLLSISKKASPPISSSANDLARQKINVAAQQVLFVESQKRPDGYYNYVYDYEGQCSDENGNKTCPFGGIQMFETTNSWAALANFSAYKISNNQIYLDKALADIQKLDEYCAKDRKQCLWVLVQPSLIYEATQNAQILAFLRSQSLALKTELLSENLMLAAIQVRSMYKLGDILNDRTLISRADSLLPQLSQSLSREANLFPENVGRFGQSSCWVALANLNSPSASFENIQAFLDNGQFKDNFIYFKNPIEIQPCIEAYFILSEKTGDLSQKLKATELQHLANEAFFDGRNENKKVYGKGGYLFNRREEQVKTPGLMVLTDVSYASYLEYLSL